MSHQNGACKGCSRNHSATEIKPCRTIENYYADLLLGYKDKRDNVLQLGLDLSGGMSILLEADMESLGKKTSACRRPR